MKDEKDTNTHDAFTTFEEYERSSLIANCLSSGGHYQAITAPKFLTVSGRRFAGTKTPDNVRDQWSTHRDVIKYMVSQYGQYDLDAAADADNTVCEKFYNEHTNCLKRWWGRGKHVWLNPPYSNPMPFVLKSIEQMQHGNQIDILLPSDNSTAWFGMAQAYAAEIIWVVGQVVITGGTDEKPEYSSRSGRLAFLSGETGNPVDNNNKGSVIFIMRKLKEGEEQKTRYVSITDICPSTLNKRMVKCK